MEDVRRCDSVLRRWAKERAAPHGARHSKNVGQSFGTRNEISLYDTASAALPSTMAQLGSRFS
jgi:hypothetical protein